jgi:hypothetical protein
VGKQLLDLPFVNKSAKTKFSAAVHRQISTQDSNTQSIVLHLHLQNRRVLLEMVAKLVEIGPELFIVMTGREVDSNLATFIHIDQSSSTESEQKISPGTESKEKVKGGSDAKEEMSKSATGETATSESNISSITAPTFSRAVLAGEDDWQQRERERNSRQLQSTEAKADQECLESELELAARILVDNDAAGTIEPLVSLLQSDNVEYQMRAATALGILAFGSESRAANIAAVGAIQPLVTMLTTGNVNGKAQAAAALRNLSHGARGQARSADIVASGAIEPLVTMLNASDHAGKANAAAALQNLKNHHHPEALLQSSSDSSSISHFEHDDFLFSAEEEGSSGA